MAATPSERLTLSRERLRQAMRADATAAKSGGSPPAGADWLSTLKGLPAFDVILETLGAWWAQHPLRNATLLVADAAKTAVQPIAQRNPLALIFGAMLLGALFAYSRPWRWLLTPALFAGLLPQLLSKAMGRVPPASWMTILASLTAQPRK